LEQDIFRESELYVLSFNELNWDKALLRYSAESFQTKAGVFYTYPAESPRVKMGQCKLKENSPLKEV